MLIRWNCKTLLVFALGIMLSASAVAEVYLGGLPTAQTAVYAVDLVTGKVVAAHRAETAMSPASTMKLVTAFAAFQHLGADYRWRTEWLSHAPLDAGHLRGKLYWRGSGDPVFDQQDLQAMQAQLRLKGVQYIDDDVVLDRSVWREIAGADDFGHDAEAAFVTPPDPQMVAYKVLWIELRNDADGVPRFDLVPPLTDLPTHVDVRWLTQAMPCSSLGHFVQADYRQGVLRLTGQVPKSCVGKQLYVNLFDAPTFAQKSFQAYWQLGGAEQRMSFTTGITPADSAVLAVHESKPLRSVVADMNKYSNNIIARTLLLTLGQSASSQQAGTVRQSKAALRQTLRAAGLDDGALVVENGSGLSRTERVSAALLGRLLVQAYQSPFAADWVASLPIGGVDGTLKNRFRHTAGQWHLKTGTLDNVRALAGYWLPEAPKQHPLAVVVLVNAPHAETYVAAMDDWLQQLPQRAVSGQLN
ncbi:D-alanyl-D-alanine carboxypeptidase/D-alanyl-D-alanine-endopeptidase [Snodgrassella sp. CFCC 13594]|uniref:D-alanyl-D-alanine carboxypeptidase/D-alanyl-D-alanine endopeptidase n=1 Tax=Snodgrassella sp. CFCC 13594 TaxID=1775559 RepID=UPI0008338438|nr:D-alanyl-D-alanine carboxypeptidase/D-alanyl-D-alanine-endopeptidase [Snodgrassella sp. CFCC 13594]